MKAHPRIHFSAFAGCAWLAAISGVCAQSEARLTWGNGESLPGELLSATESDLIWKSPIFATPVQLGLSSLRSVTVEAKGTPPDESMAFNLRDGNRVYGDLIAIDEDFLSVKSKRHGNVRLRKASVAAFHRLKGGNVLWCGPAGEARWSYGNATVGPGQRLQSVTGGALQSVAWRQQVSLPLKLPEKVEIEFKLSSSVRPEFEIRALAEKRMVTLVTWQDELVIRRGNHFVSVGALKPEDRELNLRIFWDREAGSGAVATAEGEVLGTWRSSSQEEEEAGKGGELQVKNREEVQGGVINRMAAAMFPMLAPPKPASGGRRSGAQAVDGVALTNRGPDITLDFLRVRTWDGKLPEKTSSDPLRARLELSGDSTIEGRVVRGTAETLIFQEEGKAGSGRSIPLEKVESLYFPVGPAKEDPAKIELDEFRFADGTWLRGRLLGIDNGSVKIETAVSEEPLAAKMEGIQEIRLLAAKPGAGKEAEPASLLKQDKIVTGKTTVHGSWHPAEGGRIHWRLAGASKPVEMAAASEMEITRIPPKSGDWPRSPALFHLADGQVAPGELVAIDDEGAAVEIRSEITEAKRLSADEVQAIQFRGPEVEPEGFGDPGWQIVRGGKKAIAVKSGKVTMEPGGTWGHPSILMGDEIKFTLQPTGYGTLRVRMFCEGTNADSPCSNFLLAHYGNEIYCGLEETPGQLNQRQDISVASNNPVKIRLNWDGEATKIFVNGSLAVQVPVSEKAKRSGLGLLLEPANLWGNGERQISISEFSLRAAPGVTWVPGVNVKAKEKALFLPRFRKDDPPHHMLLAPNGDLLRGTIVAAGGDRFAFRSGLENLSIPKDRVAAAIWLTPSEDEAGADEKEEPETPEKESGEPPPTHWLRLTSGARLALAVEAFGPEFVTGTSATLGRCRIPVDHVHTIRSTKPDSDPATLAFSNWRLKPAPEPAFETGGEESPMLGNAAPEIDLAILDGGRFKLSAEKGKVVVLDFWATWCSPCVRALPGMIREFSEFDSRQVRFIGVNQAEPPDLIRKFVEQRDWKPFEVALDVETSAGGAYGVQGIPYTVIVDHEGKVAWISEGFRAEGAGEAAEVVRDLLAKAADDPAVKAIREAEAMIEKIPSGKSPEKKSATGAAPVIDEPDPFDRPMKKPAAVSGPPADPKGGGGGDDEPDPFAMPQKKSAGEKSGGDGGDEPDPFAMPAKKSAGEKSGGDGKAGASGDEPDPFAAPAKKSATKKSKPAAGGKDDEPDPFGAR